MNQNVARFCLRVCACGRKCLCVDSISAEVRVCVYGREPEPISEMGFNIADSMAGLPGLKPQKLFNFQNFIRGKKYHLSPQKTVQHHRNGQIMHPIDAMHFSCAA